MFCFKIEAHKLQWRIQNFPDGRLTPQFAAETYYVTILSQIVYEMKEFGPGGQGWLPPPRIGSADEY